MGGWNFHFELPKHVPFEGNSRFEHKENVQRGHLHRQVRQFNKVQ